MKLVQEQLRDSEQGEQAIYIDLESKAARSIQDAQDLSKRLAELMVNGERAHVILDEIQGVEGWESSINSLMAGHDVNLYISSSSPSTSFAEAISRLSAQYVEIEVLPPSFREHRLLLPRDSSDAVDDQFQDFLENGALPMLMSEEEEVRALVLEGIYSSILWKDVAPHLGMVDFETLDEVAASVFRNVGKVTSPAAIAKETSLSHPTVKRYLQALVNANLVMRVPRWDIREKRYLKTTEKYYVTDFGMRNAILQVRSEPGQSLENAVYLELRRRGFQVSAGNYGGLDIDFVASKGAHKEYYQVATSILEDDVLEQEMKPLRRISDSHPKIILTLDRVLRAPSAGIRAMNAVDWMLG